MFYRLNGEYALRGWEKVTAVLVKRPENQIKALKMEEFTLLTLCDGETDFTDIPLSREQQTLLTKFVDRGIVTVTAAPTGLSEDQLYRLYPNRMVDACFWSITGRCNYRCRHCYMDAPDGALGELSHEEAVELIDQMADCGVLRVDITGGEPFVRKDFWQLIDRILSHNMTIGQVYTNGWLLTEQVLEEFENRGIRPGINISLDCLGWHDWLRGVEGAEEAALSALSLCKKRGFPTGVATCIHKGNLASFRETVNRLAELGITAIKAANISDTDLWKQNSQGLELTYGEYVDAMLAYIPAFFADGMPMDLILCGVAELNRGSTDYHVIPERWDGTESCLDCHLCGAARASCYITPEGRLLPCMPMTSCKEQEQFPLFQDIGLRAGLSDSNYMQFVDKRIKDLMEANKKCADCPYLLKCGGGCRAAALMETGNLLGEDPDLCFMWENGYVEKIHRAADEAIAKYCK